MKERKRNRCKYRRFGGEEDEVLLRAIEEGRESGRENIRKLMIELKDLKLNRCFKSVRGRIEKLKTGNPLHTVRRFTTEEDKILLEAIRNGKEGDLVKLSEMLKRNRASVRGRITKLKMTGEGPTERKLFTLKEDRIILDSALRFTLPFPQYPAGMFPLCTISVSSGNVPTIYYFSI